MPKPIPFSCTDKDGKEQNFDLSLFQMAFGCSHGINLYMRKNGPVDTILLEPEKQHAVLQKMAEALNTTGIKNISLDQTGRAGSDTSQDGYRTLYALDYIESFGDGRDSKDKKCFKLNDLPFIVDEAHKEEITTQLMAGKPEDWLTIGPDEAGPCHYKDGPLHFKKDSIKMILHGFEGLVVIETCNYERTFLKVQPGAELQKTRGLAILVPSLSAGVQGPMSAVFMRPDWFNPKATVIAGMEFQKDQWTFILGDPNSWMVAFASEQEAHRQLNGLRIAAGLDEKPFKSMMPASKTPTPAP